MPKFSANLTMLFTESAFEDRFRAGESSGFQYIEYMFPYDYPAEDLAERLRANGQKQVLFNLPAGNWAAGDRGIAVDPGRTDEFRRGVERAVEYAGILKVDRINCLVGKTIGGITAKRQRKTLVENLAYASDRMAAENRVLLIEPINTFDIPGFFLSSTRQAVEIIEDVKAKNLKIQYDVYHMQRMEGNLLPTIEKNLEHIGHIQIADNPGRHQPGTGEINFRFLLHALDRIGYPAYVGLEYIPKPDTAGSLGWIAEFGFTL